MSSRETILQRLRNRTGGELTVPECDFSVLVRDDWSTKERIERFEKMIESVHGEVHHCTEDMWMERLAEVLNTRGARNLLIQNNTKSDSHFALPVVTICRNC